MGIIQFMGELRMRIFLRMLAAVLLLTSNRALSYACTTAVISGRVTVDGRPLLWKNRDTSATLHNEVILLSDKGYRAVAVVNAGSTASVWMGANAAGFCIENSLSRDLKDQPPQASLQQVTSRESAKQQPSSQNQPAPGNGSFMKMALEKCATIEDFKNLLEETNRTGRKTVANFGVIDAQGGAAMFETSPRAYVMFDANDPAVAPKGYIVRANFSTTAQKLSANPHPGEVGEIYSGQRYLRACRLLDNYPSAISAISKTSAAQNTSATGSPPGQGPSLNFILRHMTRDMSDELGRPYPGSVNAPEQLLPPIVPTEHTISRTTTVSAAVFHGVHKGEDPRLTTMWTILGDPKFSVAVPCWAGVESIADDLTSDRGAELGEIAVTLRDWNLTADKTGVRTQGLPGIWQDVWPVEDALIRQTLAMRESWASHTFTSSDLTAFHASMTARAMAAMERELLEAKQLALAGPELIQVAIYDHSSGTAKGPKNLMQFLTPDNGFHCNRLHPKDIRNGHLDGYQVLIVPGGSGSKQAKMLEAEGCQEVREFVDSGGGYIGICAGSYLASSQYTWSLDIINSRVWDRAHWARGTGTVTLGLTDQGAEFFDQAKQQLDVYYGQGPLLVPGNNPDLPRYEVLASYASEVASKGAPVGAMLDTHAIVRSNFGSGRVVCFSPHPESSGGPNELITAGVRWVAQP